MSHNIAHWSRKQSFAKLALGVVGLLAGAVAGCGPNPMALGKPALPAGKVAEQAEKEVAAGDIAAQPNEAGAPAAAEGDRPAAKTPLIRGLSELLNTNPALEDDTKNPLRDQLEQADDILSGIKSQNRAALQQINRQQRSRRAGSPHIVLIVTDNLGLAELNSYASADVTSPELKTPYLDQLAKLGTRFDQFYTGSPNLAAADWTLATGRRPDEAKAWSQGIPELQSEDATIGETMWQAGYATGLFGNWGVSGPQGPATPADQGYDEWLGAFGPVGQAQPFPATLIQNGKLLKLTANADGKQGQLAQDFYLAEANEFLARHYRQRPLFLQLYLAVGETPAAETHAAYADKPWSDARKARATAITKLDRDIGRVLKKLVELKQLSNTIVIVTSVAAAPQFTEPNTATSNSATSDPALRGAAGELYEGGLRVPCIICGTRRIPAGQASAVVSATWDLAPTIYDLVSAQKRPAQKAGQSLLPSIRSGAKLPQRFLYWETKHGNGDIAARWQDWKAIRRAGQTSFELYDLATDPSESHDVAAEHADVITEIQKRLTPATEQAQAAGAVSR